MPNRVNPADAAVSPPAAQWPCLQVARNGVVLALSVVPGASRTELAGLHGDALRVRLSAPPVDGKANEALLAWLAEVLDVPRRRLSLLRGVSSRRKQVLVDVEPACVLAWLDGALGSR